MVPTNRTPGNTRTVDTAPRLTTFRNKLNIAYHRATGQSWWPRAQSSLKRYAARGNKNTVCLIRFRFVQHSDHVFVIVRALRCFEQVMRVDTGNGGRFSARYAFASQRGYYPDGERYVPIGSWTGRCCTTPIGQVRLCTEIRHAIWLHATKCNQSLREWRACDSHNDSAIRLRCLYQNERSTYSIVHPSTVVHLLLIQIDCLIY